VDSTAIKDCLRATVVSHRALGDRRRPAIYAYSGFERARVRDPMRRWKLSPMDLESRARWSEYSRSKDEMFRYTDIKHAPWYVVDADDKRRARLNCIAHLLSMIDYEDLTPPPLELPARGRDDAYVRPPLDEQTFVPQVY